MSPEPFFRVVSLAAATAHARRFPLVPAETLPFEGACGRVLAEPIDAPADLPGFRRSTMDGLAVRATSTFGASPATPALLEIVGEVEMGRPTALQVGAGQAARIPTGGMLPAGADAVVMIEHVEALDAGAVQVSRAVAPGQHVIEPGEDAAAGQRVLEAGTRLRPQEIGLLAGLGITQVAVRRRPVVAILSTGDEVVPAGAPLGPGQVRDVNHHTLAAMIERLGALPLPLGIVPDALGALIEACRGALAQADMVLVSGGSSVGSRDLTLEALAALPASEVLLHGVAIRPGKPTLLAWVGGKAVWGLPGHVASAMVVFQVLVGRFVQRIGGLSGWDRPRAARGVSARLSRNLASAHGRVDFVRVRLEARGGETWAVPVLGRSGLIRSLIGADGLVEIDRDTEGLEQGSPVSVQLF